MLYYRSHYFDNKLMYLSRKTRWDAQRYVSGNPISYVDPLGLDAWGDLNNLIAGFGDAGSFGLSRYIREKYGNGRTALGRTVDTSSGVYLTGEVASLAVGVGGLARVGYAGTAKALPYLVKAGSTELEHTLASSAARNNLKLIARAGMFPNYKMYTRAQVLAKYGNNAQAIIKASTRTNRRINLQWFTLSIETLGLPANQIMNSDCGAE